jgi:type II secretory pathway component PulM
MRHWGTDRRVSARDRRAIRVGAFIVAPVFVYLLALKPYLSGVRRASDEFQGQQTLLDREEAIAASFPLIKAESIAVAATQRRAASRAYQMKDTIAPIAAFGRDVTAACEEAGVSVERLEMRDSVEHRAGLQELTIDLRAEGDFKEIVNALARLEANARLIQISRFSIEKLAQSASTAGESLSFTAILRGYAR